MTKTPSTPIRSAESIVIGGKVIKPMRIKDKDESFIKAYYKFSEMMQKELKTKKGDVDKVVKHIEDEMEKKTNECMEQKKALDGEMVKLNNELLLLKTKVQACKRRRAEVDKTLEEMENHKKMKGLVSAGINMPDKSEEEEEEDEIEDDEEEKEEE